MANRIERYSKYKNVAIYTKKQEVQEDIYEHVVGKMSWMNIELEDFDVDILEFVDNHFEGEYKELNRLIELVESGKIQSILIWDFNEITSDMIDKLVEVSIKNKIYLNGFLTTINL